MMRAGADSRILGTVDVPGDDTTTNLYAALPGARRFLAVCERRFPDPT